MPVQSSGQVSLNDLHIEAGGTTGTECSFNDSDIRGLISKDAASQMRMDEWYGASNVFTFNITSNTLKGNLSSLATAAGWNGSSALECTINSGVYVWSDSRTTAALIINVAGAKVTNNGYIMGQGGNGGSAPNGPATNPTSGGPAINVTQSGTTIVNNSGAFIGGGGGGGGWYIVYRNNGDVNTNGAGGGAGGGTGGVGGVSNSANQAGATGPNLRGSGNASYGAEAGASATSGNQKYGYGGGRKMPGNSHSAGTGTGGGAGNNGSGPAGGGWGASGGSPGGNVNASGASGGAAITGTSRTLTNNGTIYGST